MTRCVRVVCSTTLGLMMLPGAATAANLDFQNFFFGVCTSPTGALALRCGETQGGAGNLSGDSESSLNPSQALSSNDGPLGQARTLVKQGRERGERLRAEEEGGIAASNRLGLIVHGRSSSYESERAVDTEAERSFEGDARGAEIGVDYRLGAGSFIGAIVGLEQTDIDFVTENSGVNFTPAATAGDSSDDSISLTLFGSASITDSFFVEGSVGYVTSDFELRRNSVFQESTRVRPQTGVRTLGSTDGSVTWAGVNFGINAQRNAVSFGPYFGATFSKSTVDGYTEADLTGSGLAMTFADIERDSLITHVGFRASIAKSIERGVVLPQFRLEYAHESEDPTQLTGSFVLDAAGVQYGLLGDEPDRGSFETGLGVAWVLASGWQPFLDARYLSGNSNLDRFRFSAGFRVEF